MLSRIAALMFIGVCTFPVQANQQAGEQFEQHFKQFQAARQQAEQGNVPAAIQAYQNLLNAQVQWPEIYNNLAALYVQQGKLDKARDLLQQGLQTSPVFKVLFDNLTVTNVAMARESYNKALQLSAQQAAPALSALNVAAPTVAKPVEIEAKPQPVVKPPETKIEAKAEIKTAAVTKTEAATKPSAEPVSVPVDKFGPVMGERQDIRDFIQQWADAWSDKNVPAYLSCYIDNYQPAGLSHAGWVEQRQQRLGAPVWIKIETYEVNVVSSDAQQAVVQFVQHYSADNYSDVSRKQMLLVHTENGWKIKSETSL